MKELKEKALDYVKKLKITTERFLESPNEIKLPNGWGKREVAIHFNGWDEIMIPWAKEIKKGKQFVWDEFYVGDHNEENAKFIEEKKDVSLPEILERFKNSRYQLIAIYEDIIDNYFQNDKRLLDYFSLFGHDVYHLKQVGIYTEDLED